MRREPIVLFDNGSHQCLCFDDLVSGEGVQSNQFLIVDNGQYLLLDPGGDLTYTPLSLELSKRFPLQELDYIFASHQDPDIIAALDKWLLHTRARVICSKLWARFLPHLTANYLAVSHGINTYDRVIPLTWSAASTCSVPTTTACPAEPALPAVIEAVLGWPLDCREGPADARFAVVPRRPRRAAPDVFPCRSR